LGRFLKRFPKEAIMTETVAGLIGGGLGILILLSLWAFDIASRRREHPRQGRLLHWMEDHHIGSWMRHRH
jgi:hypothetical protein